MALTYSPVTFLLLTPPQQLPNNSSANVHLCSSPQLVLSAVFIVMLAIGRGQLQYFYPFGASLTGHQQQQQQQQLYQSAGTPTQGVTVQVTNPAGLNYLQTSPQEAAPYVPASNVNQK